MNSSNDRTDERRDGEGLQTKVMADLMEEVENKGYEYECGDCAKKVFLKPQDPVRCQECGHRILYKPRTRRVIQYEAR